MDVRRNSRLGSIDNIFIIIIYIYLATESINYKKQNNKNNKL